MTRAAREHGAALLLSMLAVLALVGLGAAAVLGTRRGTEGQGGREARLARRAAEAGVAVGLERLARSCDESRLVAAPLRPRNEGAAPVFGPAGPYTVWILNDPADPAFDEGVDGNGVVLVRAVGRSPGGLSVTIEARVAVRRCGELSVLGWRERA